MNDLKHKTQIKFQIIPYTVMLFFLIFLLYHFLQYLEFAYHMAMYPFDIDVGEGLIINRAFILSLGQNVYSPITEEPFFVMNYTPFFELIVAGLIKIFGPSLLMGRAVSIISTLFSSVFIYMIVRSVTHKKVAALFSGLLFISSSWVIGWSVLCRVDMFAVMLTLAGLCIVSNEARSKHKGMIVCAVILFIGAIFTRQSMIAAPMAFLLYLFLNKKENTQFLFYIVLMFFLGIVLTGLLQLMSGGEFFRHAFVYTLGTFSMSSYIHWLSDFVKMHWAVVLISSIFVTLKIKKKDYQLVVFFWIFSLLVTITAGKLGASINYFIEFYAACCIVLAVALNQLISVKKINWNGKIVSLSVLMLLAIQLYQMKQVADFTLPNKDQKSAAQTLTQLIQQSSGEVLSEYTGYLIQNGKQAIFQPFSMTQLSRSGQWDQSGIVSDIENQRFELIVLTTVGVEYDRWTPEIKEAVKRNYTKTHILPTYELSFYNHAVNTHLVYRKNGMNP